MDAARQEESRGTARAGLTAADACMARGAGSLWRFAPVKDNGQLVWDRRAMAIARPWASRAKYRAVIQLRRKRPVSDLLPLNVKEV